MTNHEKQLLIKSIERFDNTKNEMSPVDAEHALLDILTPLLKSEDYEVQHIGGVNDGGVDFLVRKENERIGIEYKPTRRPIGGNDVQQLIGAAIIKKLDKVILLTNSTFSSVAREYAYQVDPIAIQLLDINDLKNWTSRVEANFDYTDVITVIKTCSQQLIKLITQNPRNLDQIEWRDLERIIAEVFEGIGFNVTLTPPSKDGGKDVILECTSKGFKNSYIVEIKHWRSGQKVGQKSVKDFVQVIAKEKRNAGLFLSTYGYTENVAESLTQIEKQKVKFGQESKIISLCQTYLKTKSGLYHTEQNLANILFEEV